MEQKSLLEKRQGVIEHLFHIQLVGLRKEKHPRYQPAQDIRKKKNFSDLPKNKWGGGYIKISWALMPEMDIYNILSSARTFLNASKTVFQCAQSTLFVNKVSL